MRIERRYKYMVLLAPLAAAFVVFGQNCSKKQPASDEDIAPVQTNYPVLGSAVADSALSSTGPFTLSVPNGSGYIDVSFTEDAYIPNTMVSVQATASTAQVIADGTIRFFHGTLVSSGVNGFDFARLVAIQQAGGKEYLYFVGQYGTQAVYANWATGDTAVTIKQIALDDSAEWAVRTATAVTAHADLLLNSAMVNAWGSASNARLEALADLYFADGIHSAGLKINILPIGLTAYTAGDPTLNVTDPNTLLANVSAWGQANQTAGSSFVVLVNSGATGVGSQNLAYTGGACLTGYNDLFYNGNPSLPFVNRVTTLAHEIGHQVSLKHVQSEAAAASACPGALMCQTGPTGMKFLTFDLQNLVIPSCIH